ncbi:HhH-GPD-type base excision DNA repair protein [soil metagenome]
MAATVPDRLHFTGDTEADQLLVREPLALLIGFVLDQQVSVQKAFSGPLELRRRLGSLDVAQIASMDATALEDAFRQRPALHRFPASMARRTQELCAAIAGDYDGDAARLWTEASDGPDLRRRLGSLPGFGAMKVDALVSVLARRFGVELPSLEDVMPRHPTLGDVDSPEGMARYQEQKRARKAALRDGPD